MAGSPKTSAPTWTPQQRQGIETTGANLLVSAAAGSGKTAVLSERCAYLVCDANPPCNVDELLVVTFTEAAAAEMKRRIAVALRKRLEFDPHNRRLQTQLALIDRAQVSTLHAFCARLLRKHFHVIGLDPGFAILDGDEAKLLRAEVARDLFTDRYESRRRETDSRTSTDTGAFLQFIDDYGDGNDDGLRRQVVSTHELLGSLIDPEAWMKEAQDKLNEAATLPLSQSALGRELASVIKAKLDALVESCRMSVATIKRMAGFEKYESYLKNLQSAAFQWQSSFGVGDFDALATNVNAFEAAKLPNVSNGTLGKELAKSTVDAIRSQMGRSSSLLQLLRFSTTEWGQGLRSIEGALKVFLDLVRDFATRYRAAKQRIRSLDFNDLERSAWALLTDESNGGPSVVARLCHRQLQHVLVDEYQDINEIQDGILRRVSREMESIPNLFCVGDVKQSIYGFRLAEPEQFLRRQACYRSSNSRDGLVVDLQQNFRSRHPLLNSVNLLFARLMTKAAVDIEYNQSQELRPGAVFAESDEPHCFTRAPVELHLLPSPAATENFSGEAVEDAEAADVDLDSSSGLDRTQREASFIAYRIKQLIGAAGQGGRLVYEKETGKYRPLKYRDIVVLIRATQFKAEQISQILRQHEVPVHRTSATGYFESMEIRDLLAVLQLLDNGQQDIPLAAFLRSPMAGLAYPEDALVRIRLSYPGGDRPIPLHVAAQNYAAEQRDELAARLREVYEVLHRWRHFARQRPLSELIWSIYDQSGYLTYCSGLVNGDQRVANLLNLHERAQQFGGFAQQGLYRFLSFLHELQSEADQGQPSVLSEGEDVVRVMSIHKSKGLEFPVVFLADLGKRMNLRGSQGSILVDRTLHLGLKVIDQLKQVRYPSLAHVLVERRLKQQMLAEEMRVLYVAMTRATEHLILVGTAEADQGEKWDRRWGEMLGQFPTDMILSASTWLDWIGPATSAIAASNPAAFNRIAHSSEELATWASDSARTKKTSPLNVSLQMLQTFDVAPSPSPIADRVISRLSFIYPQLPFSTLQAAISVTALTKRGAADQATRQKTEGSKVEVNRLALPVFLASETVLKPDVAATDIGTATHLVLQHLRFEQILKGHDLTRQIDRMLAQHLISTQQAAWVDRESILWFVDSPLGRMLCETSETNLLREIPFNYALAPQQMGRPPSSDPMDQVMVRGRIDLLVRQPNGLRVIDYKTDRVWDAQLEERCNHYTGQVHLYRDAIQRFTRLSVTASHLVFLTPREIRNV